MKWFLDKDNAENYIKNINLSPYHKEFKENKELSDETLEKILERKPILSSDYAERDSYDMAVEQLHLWRTCESLIYARLEKEAV